MPLVIEDPETHRLAQALAALRGVAPAEAVRMALEHEFDRSRDMARPEGVEGGEHALAHRLQPVWNRLEALGDRGQGREADKAFFDDLSGV